MKDPETHPPEEPRKALDEARNQLLTIHKTLLDHERARYERTHGAIGSIGALLQLVIHDPWFAWLKPLSALITEMDEYSAAKSPPDAARAEALLKESRSLLSPDEAGSAFQQAYLRALQESTDVAYLHGEWKKTQP